MIKNHVLDDLIIIIIMLVYLIADIPRNQQHEHPPRRAALYAEGLSTAKLLPHTAHSS